MRALRWRFTPLSKHPPRHVSVRQIHACGCASRPSTTLFNGVGPDEARLVGGARRWMSRRGIDIVGGDGAPLAASHARAPYDGAYWMRSRRGASASMTARRPLGCLPRAVEWKVRETFHRSEADPRSKDPPLGTRGMRGRATAGRVRAASFFSAAPVPFVAIRRKRATRGVDLARARRPCKAAPVGGYRGTRWADAAASCVLVRENHTTTRQQHCTHST